MLVFLGDGLSDLIEALVGVRFAVSSLCRCTTIEVNSISLLYNDSWKSFEPWILLGRNGLYLNNQFFSWF